MAKKKTEPQRAGFYAGRSRVTIEFLEPMLGTVPKDPQVYAQYIATKAPEHVDTSEEVESVEEALEEIEEKGWTGFHTDENGLFLYDYMPRGHIKTGVEVAMGNGAITKIVAYKKWIDLCVFVFPRRIYFNKPEPDGILERPLRVMTPKGPRVTVTRSDYVAEGTQITFEIELFKNVKGLTWDVIDTALSFGSRVGYGQWRGSGSYGRFKVLERVLL